MSKFKEWTSLKLQNLSYFEGKAQNISSSIWDHCNKKQELLSVLFKFRNNQSNVNWKLLHILQFLISSVMIVLLNGNLIRYCIHAGKQTVKVI